jgi:hypothetical protein
LRRPRLIMVLLAGGFMFLAAAILLSTQPASATSGRSAGTSMGGWRYTDNAQPVSTGRVVALYIDRDFDDFERQRIVSAMRQWNYVLNGFVQFRASYLPDDPSPSTLAQIRRGGGWVVARVDSRHPIAQQGEGRHALAVTAGNRGGFVYVISDRIGQRDLGGVMMHEFGHVLGAGHDERSGLMAPVYSSAMGRCIDRESVWLVAQAQRLPLNRLNWCVGPGDPQRSTPMVQGPQQYDYRNPMAQRQR